ncbi:MAG: alpha/beta fold hydrolase [Endozoicomonas sp.]
MLAVGGLSIAVPRKPWKDMMMDYCYKNINGLRLRVGISTPRRYPEQKLPLLLCNGLGASIELMQPIVDALESTQVVIFDPPGIGLSEPSDQVFRLSELADMAYEIMTSLGHQYFNVMGVSWGGGLAQMIARNHRDACCNLILAATGTGMFMIPGKLSVLKLLSSPRRYKDPEYAETIMPDIYGGVFRENPDLLKKLTGKGVPPTDQGYQNQLAAGVGWTSVWWLHTLKQPTLILMGKDDPIVPSVNGMIFRSLIRKSELKLFDCGHLFMVTQPEQTAGAINQFLLKHKTGSCRPFLATEQGCAV